LEITRISFAAYNKPITAEGTLPVRLFGGKLNLKRLKEKNIPWLICYGTHDDLVEKETALAPLEHVDAEVTPFPKGHVAIATSWSSPQSACALHTRFGDGDYRGPVRYHMDLDAALYEAKHQTAGASQPLPSASAQPNAGSVAPKAAKKTAAARKKAPPKGPVADKQTTKPAQAAKKKPNPVAKATPAKTKRPTAPRTKAANPTSPRGGK
jgi:hypothetical protein